jgi:hypothetical protein
MRADINFFLADLETVEHFGCSLGRTGFGTGNRAICPTALRCPFHRHDCHQNRQRTKSFRACELKSMTAQ